MRCLAWNHELLDERDEWSSCQCQARQEIAEKRYERQPQTDSGRTAGKTQLDVLSVLAFSLAGQRSTSMANEHALARPHGIFASRRQHERTHVASARRRERRTTRDIA